MRMLDVRVTVRRTVVTGVNNGACGIWGNRKP